MLCHHRVSHVAVNVGGQILAVVVVEPDRTDAAGKNGQYDEADHQMPRRMQHDPDTGPPPKATREFTSWLDETAAPGESDDRGQQCDGCEKPDDDGDGQ